MELWRRYVAWVDNSLGDGWPRPHSAAMLIPWAPVLLGIFYHLLFGIDHKPGHLEAILILVPSTLLLGVTSWRFGRSLLRQFRMRRE